MKRNAKKLFIGFLVLMLISVCFAFGASAEWGENLYTEGIFTYTIYDNGHMAYPYATIESIDTTGITELTIPETLGGYPVTNLSWYDLLGSKSSPITHLILPKTIESVWVGYDNNLEHVTIDEENPYFTTIDGVVYNKEVTAIEGYPREKKDTHYDIPDTVEAIPDSFNLKYVETFDFPKNLKKIGTQAFTNSFDTLKDIILPEGLELIESYAFASVDIENLVIPAGVKVEDYAFSFADIQNITINCEMDNLVDVFIEGNIGYATVAPGLKTISSEDGVIFNGDKTVLLKYCTLNPRTEYVVPEGVKEIAEAAFMYSFILKKITFPDSLEKVNRNGFGLAINLEEVNFGKGLKTVEYGAFAACEDLKEIILPEGFETVIKSAFAGCYSVERLYIPSTLKNIGLYAFAMLGNAKEITVAPGNEILVTDEYGNLYTKDMTKLITLCAKSGQKAYKLPETVTAIEPSAFFGSSATALNIHEKIDFEVLKESGIGYQSIKTTLLPEEVGEDYPRNYLYDMAPSIVTIYGLKGSAAEEYVNEFDGQPIENYYEQDWVFDLTFVDLATHAHTYTETVITPATCLDKGLNKFTCDCCYEYTTELPLTDHTDADANNKCDVCNKTIKEEPKEEEPSKSFIDQIIEFFQMIIDFLKNLFNF